MVLYGVFGMNFSAESLAFAPFLPGWTGSIELKGLAYRDSNLDITVEGRGHIVKSFTLDGKEQPDHSLPSTMKGNHAVVVELE